jgi:hypothetical protein
MLLNMAVIEIVGFSKLLKLGSFYLSGDLNTPESRKVVSEYNNFPFVLAGDEAYLLTVNQIRPFPLKPVTSEGRISIYGLARARGLIECAFGIIGKSYRVLEKAMLLSSETAALNTMATCVLRNSWRKTPTSTKIWIWCVRQIFLNRTQLYLHTSNCNM